MFSTLYGQTAAALYAKAAGQNAQARQLYNASADTYYKANESTTTPPTTTGCAPATTGTTSTTARKLLADALV